jgi:hypothetical protein
MFDRGLAVAVPKKFPIHGKSFFRLTGITSTARHMAAQQLPFMPQAPHA